MSASNQENRFENHLWLRALNRFPQKMASARAAYLGNRNKWKTGSDHPWPLILAYRAWLLQDAGETEEARSHLDEAVGICLDDNHGVTLKWMALVLSTMAQAIGVPLASSDHTAEDGLRKRLQHAPWEALAEFSSEASHGRLSSDRVWAHLGKCLPFNFH